MSFCCVVVGGGFWVEGGVGGWLTGIDCIVVDDVVIFAGFVATLALPSVFSRVAVISELCCGVELGRASSCVALVTTSRIISSDDVAWLLRATSVV